MVDAVTSGTGFSSKSLGLRAQKKILGKMSSKGVAKAFVDDTTARVLDNLYRIAKDYTQNKKEAEKIMKNLIKTVIKVGVLYRNDQFSDHEMKMATAFRRKFHTTALTVISFYEVEHTYDRAYLADQLHACCKLLKELVGRHLTEKSISRIDQVFDTFSSATFLDQAFQRGGPHWTQLGHIVADLKSMEESGGL